MRISVRLSPRAKADRLDGIARLADGAPVLVASVTAPPVAGLANEALLRLLAKKWKLARRDLAIVGGQKTRTKLVQIAGDARVLLPQLTTELAVLPRK